MKNIQTLTIGISSCLLGHPVRYDGAHSHSKTCIALQKKSVCYISFCPEVAAGFGTPRAPMNLVGDQKNPRLKYAKKQGPDLTEKLVSGFSTQLENLNQLDGYITKSRSPSCGLKSTPVYTETGETHQETGSGLFIAELKERYPLMPIAEEVELENEMNRARFLKQVYAYHLSRSSPQK